MYHNFWSKAFDDVGVEYEGNCFSFEDGKSIVVSTPFTSTKCRPDVDAVIVDEVHHAFGDPRYVSNLLSLRPKIIVGFTALLPSKKRYGIDTKLAETFGTPSLLAYDFRRLSEIDPSFALPKAIADVFDSEMDGSENMVYNALLKGKIKGDERTISYLRYSLYSHGKTAFCESLENLREKVVEDGIVRSLCSSEGLGHKARTLKEILEAYGVEEYNPVLIFTSRRATAHEFEIVLHNMGVTRVRTLTGELTKEERLQIIADSKKGLVDVIISTHVGEEGVDIPEARLLIMADVPKDPLKFYQRLGRLIRKTEDTNIKYLVVTLTPKTQEYDNLDEALRALHREGVDVSYILEKKTGKGTTSLVVDQVKANHGVVPLMKLLESDYQLKDYLLIKGKTVLDLLHSNERDTPFADFIDRAISEGELLYYYDPEKMGDLIAKILLSKYCTLCYGERCRKICSRDQDLISLGGMKQYKLVRKDLLRYFMVIFTEDRIEDMKSTLSNISFDSSDFRLTVQSSANDKNNSIIFLVQPEVTIDGITVDPKITIAYYGIRKELKDFLKSNVIAVCRRSAEKYFSFFTS